MISKSVMNDVAEVYRRWVRVEASQMIEDWQARIYFDDADNDITKLDVAKVIDQLNNVCALFLISHVLNILLPIFLQHLQSSLLKVLIELFLADLHSKFLFFKCDEALLFLHL